MDHCRKTFFRGTSFIAVISILHLSSTAEKTFACQLLPLANASAHQEGSAVVTTRYGMHISVQTANGREICSFQHHLSEYGRYHINVTTAGFNRSDCFWYEEPNNHSAYTPLYVLLGVLLSLILLYNVGSWFVKKYRGTLPAEHRFAFVSRTSRDSVVSTDSAAPILQTPPSRRLRSLDCFRGITILLMIFVNSGAGGYWFLNHAVWNGLNVADCVFPWFMFIMGVAIHISMRSVTKKNLSKNRLMLGILRRTALLFLFGLIINSTNYQRIEELRLFSVLGRFSFAYFIVATTELVFAARISDALLVTRYRFLRDILPFWPTALISICFPLTQLLFTFMLKVPGCPQLPDRLRALLCVEALTLPSGFQLLSGVVTLGANERVLQHLWLDQARCNQSPFVVPRISISRGYMGPGGFHNGGAFRNCTGGAAGYIDQRVVGFAHMYQNPTCRPMYKSIAYDPEGILGYLNSIFLVFLGVQAGKILFLYDTYQEKLIRLAVWGVVLGLIAGGLCGFSQNGGWIPVNKSLWSLSFILALASLGMLILGFLYYVIDVLNVWSGAPFHYPSVNSIVLYVASEILDDKFPFWWNMPDTHSGQLFMALWTTFLWWLISVWMYWRKIFIAL